MEKEPDDNHDSESETTSIPNLEVETVNIPREEINSEIHERKALLEASTKGLQPKQKSRFSTVFFILIVIGVAVWLIPDPKEEFLSASLSEKPESPIKISPTIRYKATIYIPDTSNSQLLPVETNLEAVATEEGKVRVALVALIENENFTLMPKETSLREVFVYDNMAVVSVDTSFRSNFEGGASEELLAITAIVNTAVDASTKVKSVTILMDDKNEDIFVSHVDISRPFFSDHSFDAPPVRKSK